MKRPGRSTRTILAFPVLGVVVLVGAARAVKDYHPGQGPLTRSASGPGVYSPTGVWGDPTLATLDKGRVIVEAMVKDILADIEALRRAPLP